MSKRHARCSLAVLFALTILGLFLFATIPAHAGPQATSRYVDPTGSDAANNCTNLGTPCATIQHALDVANPGDEVHLVAGTYHEHITMTEDVSIYGQGWGSTVIHGDYAAPRATVQIDPGVSAGAVLSGVQVTGGGTGAVNDTARGGGINIGYASPRIINTWVYSCAAQYGGGVYVNAGAPTFENVPVSNCRADRGGGFYLEGNSTVEVIGNPFVGVNGTVLWNSAAQDGGGFFISDATVTLAGLRVYWNTAQYGGGLYVGSTPNRVTLLLNDISGNSVSGVGTHGGGIETYNATGLEIGLNHIANNTADSNGAGAMFIQSAGLVQANWFMNNTAGSLGGGMSVETDSSALTVRSNWFEGNSAAAGGGLNLASGAVPWIDANTFATNTAPMGGGIYMYLAGPVSITNNILARNVGTSVGGGIAVVDSPPRIVNNTIAENVSDGVWFSNAENMAIVNNIIYGNTGDGVESDSSNPTSIYTLDYNDWFGNGNAYKNVTQGLHKMTLDPQFAADDPNVAAYYHIQASSPISATGSVDWAPTYDFDAEWRALDGAVSMGADEIPIDVKTIFLPCVLKN